MEIAICLVLGILKKPDGLWNMGKIEAFKKALGVVGTQIFISVWGVAALVGGILILALKA